MASYPEVTKRWCEIVTGVTDKRPLRAERMPVEFARDRYGVNGSDPRMLSIFSYGSHFELARLIRPKDGAPFFLVNGDTYSVTTARHQREIRSAIAATGLASVIVPHTAAQAAGIVLDTVRVLASEDERNEVTTHTLTLPDGMRADMLTELTHTARVLYDELRAELDGDEYSWGHNARFAEVARRVGGDKITARVTVAGYEYNADGTGGWKVNAPEDWQPRWYRNGGGLTWQDGDTFTYDTYRHFLGASVFTAKVAEYREREVSRVLASEDDGSEFVSGVSRRDVGGWHVYSVRVPINRTAAFVSAFDDETAARRPLYFLAELPAKVRPSSVAEALEALAPDEVRTARDAGADVKRQGDIFAVPLPDIADALPIPFRYAERNGTVALDGTNSHTVTELVTFADGSTFGRGVLRHTRGEHKQVRLDGWHALYRNLVPLQRPNVRPVGDGYARGGLRAVAGQPRAFTISGSVD